MENELVLREKEPELSKIRLGQTADRGTSDHPLEFSHTDNIRK